MLLLVFYAAFDAFHAGLAYRECTVPGLPVKLGIPRSVGFHPFRTSFFHLLDNLFQSMVFGKRKERMNMVVHPPDQKCGTIPFLEDARLLGEQVLAVPVGNPGVAVLGAVNEMNEIFHQRLRHVMDSPICGAHIWAYWRGLRGIQAADLFHATDLSWTTVIR